LGAVSSFAVFGIAAPASAEPGYIGGRYQRSESDVAGVKTNSDRAGIEGAITFSPSETLGVDLYGSASDANNTDETIGVSGHVYGRGADYKVGGFGTVADANGDFFWESGVEAQKSWNAVTLAGVVSYGDNDDANVNAWGTDAEARFCLTDNLRLDGKAGWHKVDFGGATGEDDVWNAGAGAEWKLGSSPLRLTAGYDRYEFNDLDAKSDVWTVGARYSFGGSLKDRDRTGPSFGGLSSLSRAVAF
jgi:hypothetical protein